MNTFTNSRRRSVTFLAVTGLAGAAATVATAATLTAVATAPAESVPDLPQQVEHGSAVTTPSPGRHDPGRWEIRCMRVPSAHDNDNPHYCLVPRQR